MAQNDFPEPPEPPQMPPMTIEERAQKMTDRLSELLNLTEKQYKKVYRLNLNELKEMEADSLFLGRRGMGFGPGGPGFGPGGQGGPGGPGGRAQFERDMEKAGREFTPLSPQQMEQLKAAREQARLKKDKKMRKILSDEQYGIWVRDEQERLIRMQQRRNRRGPGHRGGPRGPEGFKPDSTAAAPQQAN